MVNADPNTVSVLNGQLSKDSFWTQFCKKVHPNYRKAEQEKVVKYLIDQVTLHPEQEGLQDLTAKVIQTYQKDGVTSSLLKLDHISKRIFNKEKYILKRNSDNFKKWTEIYKFQAKDFEQHTDFYLFAMEKSPLAKQMSIFRTENTIQDGKMLIEGVRHSLDEIPNKFKVKHYQEDTLLVDKTNELVYTYLGNGKGLEKYDPYLDVSFNHPIYKMDQEERDELLEHAKTFQRPNETEEEAQTNNSQRDYVFQIVLPCENLDKYENSILKNIFKLNPMGTHPYIRTVDPQGNVSEMGFLGLGVSPLPFMSQRGDLRGIDLYTYKRPYQRKVLSIAMSQKEYQSLIDFHKELKTASHREGKNFAFRFSDHNCTTFVNTAVQKAFGFEIPVKIPFHEAIYRIYPDALQKIFYFQARCNEAIKAASEAIAPKVTHEVAQYITALRDGFYGVLSQLFALITGGFISKNNIDITQPNQPQRAQLGIFARYIDSNETMITLPGLLKDWIEQQPSVQTFDHPTHFCGLNK